MTSPVPSESETRPGAPTVTSDGRPTLADVIRVIPKRCYRNPTAKGLAYVVRDFTVYGLIVAGLLMTDTWWLLVPLWILAGMSVAGLFVLGHDAAHGALFTSKRLNTIVARVAMLPSIHSLEAWDLGHNRVHHGHTGKQEVDLVWHPTTLEEWAVMPTWQRLRHRLEWSAFGAGFYYGREVWWHKIMNLTAPQKWVAKVRHGKVWILVALLAAAVAVGGVGWLRTDAILGVGWAVIKVVVVPWALFIWLIGFTVYVHHISEDITWHTRSTWTRFEAQMAGTTFITTPRGFNLFFHHILVHVPHHVDMRIPFYELPTAAHAIAAAYPDLVQEQRLSLRRYWRTTKQCKLYDFEHGTWLPYPPRHAGDSAS